MAKRIRKRSSKRRHGPKRAAKRSRRGRKSLPHNHVVVTEVVEKEYVGNQVFFSVFPGITGPRAQALAPQFGFYRIARVSVRFIPKYDTFAPALATGAGPVTVPLLFFAMNRYAATPATGVTFQNLRDLGTKGKRLDDKILTYSYTPNIFVQNQLNGVPPGDSSSGVIKKAPWLTTDLSPYTAAAFSPSTTFHYGHFQGVECSVAGDGTASVYAVQTTITYHFKAPRVVWGSP